MQALLPSSIPNIFYSAQKKCFTEAPILMPFPKAFQVCGSGLRMMAVDLDLPF